MLNRLVASISQLTKKEGVTTRFLKLLIFFENFWGVRYIFSCHLSSK